MKKEEMMWFKRVSCVILILVVPVVHSECPPPEDVLPCRCDEKRHINQFPQITCTNIYSEPVLEHAIQGSRGYDISACVIIDSSLRYLPRATFNGTKFTHFEVTNSSLISLSDGEFAFEGLEFSLFRIVCDGCTLVNDWDWSPIRKLRSCDELTVKNSDLVFISENLKQVAQKVIRLLYFDHNSITWLPDDIFLGFSRLVVCDLSHNLITEVKRSMFPNPAPIFSSLDLSFNQIQHLPKDIFTNMPDLNMIYLTGNKLFTLDEETFLPVWGQLLQFSLNDPIMCDCYLTWITKVKGPQILDSRCGYPPSLKDKRLKELTSKDLWC